MRRLAGTALAVFTLCAVALAQSLGFPQLTGRVVDDAGLLNAAARTELEQTLADLEQKTTDQLVVVTLKSLQGTSIEDYGYQLGRHWQIGQKDKNNGVLLIVAPNERKVRIEVGYGLEGTLTDAIASFIVQTAILPRFKAGDFPGGIRRGVEDIVQVLSGDAEDYAQRAARAAEPSLSPEELFVMMLFLFVAVAIIMNIIGGMWAGAVGNGRGRGRRGGNFPIIIGPPSRGGWSSGGSSGGGWSGGGGSFGGGGSSGSW